MTADYENEAENYAATVCAVVCAFFSDLNFIKSDVLQCKLFRISLNLDERCMSVSAENIDLCRIYICFASLVSDLNICCRRKQFTCIVTALFIAWANKLFIRITENLFYL